MAPPVEASSEEGEETALEETAREKLGLERWDRPVIFRETAEAAVDVDLPYWSVLMISGAIATLGLALDSAAVVIGAMLIAPLLAPVMGLALALAVGDVRLAVQTGITVVVSTAAVILAAALLTLALPFESVTPQISSRTRPSTLDLGIAVFSGLAGGVVAVTGHKRLSAAIPGVAIAVALIPPLAVAGFAIGAGGRWALLKGSMLLYGANLSGIVFSGTLVFLLVGMHRTTVVEAAMRWHEKSAPTGLAAWMARSRWVQSLKASGSPLTRMGFVVALVGVLAIPLSVTLVEIARETRVQRAVSDASEMFNIPGRSSVLSQQLEFGDNESQVYLRVATTEWFGSEARETFERTASARAGEPVRIVLEQLPTSAGDIEQLADLLPADEEQKTPPSPQPLAGLLVPVWQQVQQSVAALPLPEDAHIVGAELVTSRPEQTRIRIAYVASRSFSEDTQEILARQLTGALAVPDVTVDFHHISPVPRPLTGGAADSVRLQEAAALAKRYDGLRVEIAADTSAEASPADTTAQRLIHLGLAPEQVSRRTVDTTGLHIRLSAAPSTDWTNPNE